MASIETDWIERLIKLVLPGTPRRWVRRRRRQRFFQESLKPTDVFLVGHPKSGNTWLAYMLALLQAGNARDRVTLANLKEYVPFLQGRDIRIADFHSLSHPRIFREEYPLHDELYPKVLYLVRDPRAVIVSLYHMYCIECNDPAKPMDEFVDDYLYARGCFDRWNRGLIRWDRQVATWTGRTGQPGRVLVLRYEAMVQDRRRVLESAAQFAGLVTTEPELEEAVLRGSFQAMQQMESRSGTEAYPAEMAQRGRFIRRGETDGWKDELPRGVVDRIEKEFAPVMKAIGYL